MELHSECEYDSHNVLSASYRKLFSSYDTIEIIGYCNTLFLMKTSLRTEYCHSMNIFY